MSMVPGKGARLWQAPKGMVGAMSTSLFFSIFSSRCSGMMVSVPRGMWRPWLSMLPMLSSTMSLPLK